MVQTRQYFKKKSFHCRRKAPMSSKNLLKLQFWLWRKRQEIGHLGRSRIKGQVLKNLYCSRPRSPFKTNSDMRITKTQGTSDVTTSCASKVLGNGTAEKKVEMCKVNCSHLNQNNVHSVSSDADYFDDFKRDCSHCVPAENGECLHTVVLKQNSAIDVVRAKENRDISVEIGSPFKTISNIIREFLHEFHQKYGSFIPLEKSDLLNHLKEKSHEDLDNKDDELLILEITIEEMAKMVPSIPYFQVKYKKHVLTLYDLSTLANENWLNDQVINMYGELIMDMGKVNFLNSFFYEQLITKGYEGVKRWTKNVNLFSKRLLLVPIHLDVHWCLVAADLVKKKVCLYDSQGIGFYEVARNIWKYLLREAKEKKKAAFEEGWTVSLVEEIPQQTNENDCGVFVLKYARCLALFEPLQFSQSNIPKIRKIIYKELCECKLHDKC